VLPATERGIRRYLGSGPIKGIGPVMATRIDHFGVDVMHVIDDDPARLVEVSGLGPKRCAGIAVAWAEQQAIKEAMVFPQRVGVSTSLAVKIYKKYGGESVETVRREPYRLAADIWWVGFKTPGTIAASVAIARDSPERIRAGLAYTQSAAADDGHCYIPEHELVAEGVKLLGVSQDAVAAQVPDLAAEKLAVRDKVPDGDGTTEAACVLASKLVKAVPPGAHLLLVGDQSGIVVNAHKVNAGRPAQQVLCPMDRGPAGTGNLNALLQEALTPYREGGPERRYGGRVFCVGDKVTQLRNNYDKGAAGVLNGTTDVIAGMFLDEHALTVRTDEDEETSYDFDELAHAYAVTIHHSQGSKYPAVVIALTTSACMILQRNLLYTGITPAKKLVILAGSRKTLAAAVRTAGTGRRPTTLGRRLLAAL
jgi:ATP-dependent exoDNAse (exonuclease V) alpha subunit